MGWNKKWKEEEQDEVKEFHMDMGKIGDIGNEVQMMVEKCEMKEERIQGNPGNKRIYVKQIKKRWT